MNFLRSSLFSDAESRPSESSSDGQEASDDGENEVASSGWSFGSLVKTLGKVSGEVLQAYKQDLTEFADGLKKETEVVAEVTVHAVKDLPHTLETGAVVAQESLESVGQSLEEFGGSIWRGTSELIASVREAVKKVDDDAVNNNRGKATLPRELSATPVTSWKYSRYEAQVNAMQRDSSTYCDEPEDADDYVAWRSTFSLNDKKPDIAALLKDNAFMQELEARIVPLVVEYDTFWTRYFFRLHKLQLVEDARADLVKRATASEEEELSWDVEEENEEVKADPNSISNSHTEVATEAIDRVFSDTENPHGLRFEAGSSAGSSASGGRQSEQGAITTDQPGGLHDEEAVSEGSTGSDWLVVQEDKDQAGVDTPTESTASTPFKDEGSLSSVVSRGATIDADEPELEEIGDLSLDDMPNDQTETMPRKTVVDRKPVADEPEDWGDWE